MHFPPLPPGEGRGEGASHKPPLSPTIQPDTIRDRAHGRLVTVPRKRPWTHLLWRQGPRDAKPVFSQETRNPITKQKQRPTPVPLAPLVLVRTVADRQLIVALSEEARSFGIRPEMTLAEARALCSKVQHADHDPARDERALEALARWMIRFTPSVSIREGLVKHEDIKHDEREDYLFLDLTGCERFFGGLENIIQAVSIALKRMRISFAIGIGPTPGSAYARTTKQFSIDNCQFSIVNLLDFLSPLPVQGLRIPSETCAALHHLGIETIGQLLALPRESIPSRFGHELLLRLDQALGKIPEPLTPLPHFSPIEASMEFEGTVESLEIMWIAMRDLLRTINKDLAKRACGAREIKVTFHRPYADSIEKTVRLSSATRNVKELFELLRCALEQIETDVGFIGIALHITRFERIREAQFSLVQHEQEQGALELDRLIERLIARMGERGLRQIKLVESHLPERAWTDSSFAKTQHSALNTNDFSPRPLQLLDPVEVKVMVSPSHDRDGRPILFRHGRDLHELRHAIGPERISGEWWRSHHKTRDYFEVEDQSGKRFWLFRVNESNKWFLHGSFC